MPFILWVGEQRVPVQSLRFALGDVLGDGPSHSGSCELRAISYNASRSKSRACRSGSNGPLIISSGSGSCNCPPDSFAL